MRILTRKGTEEDIKFDKVTQRIALLMNLKNDLDRNVIRPEELALKVIQNIDSNSPLTTWKLDEISARLCMNYSLTHPDYAVLGSRIIVSNHQKNVKWSFFAAMYRLRFNIDAQGKPAPLLSEGVFDFIDQHQVELDAMLVPERDFLLNYFGFKTLERSYLLRTSDKIIRETPQYMFLRDAIGIFYNADTFYDADFPNDYDLILDQIKKTYDMMSLMFATHATPTLYNSGTKNPNFASCFLLGTGDSVEDMYKTVRDCALISKRAGGIGIHLTSLRGDGSYIRGNGGRTNGILPYMKVLNETACHINQGSKRKGAFAVYLEPWHTDIMEFLRASRNHGDEKMLARDLFFALWIPNNFMKATEEDQMYYLMCPEECPGLTDAYGEEFDKLYQSYVDAGKYRKAIKAREIFQEMVVSQIESGMPYTLYKDHVNEKSNQKNIGTIKSSNLCVAGHTRILTKEYGEKAIEHLVNRKVHIWNGKDWSKVTVRCTNEEPQDLLQIEFSSQRTLVCTPYHKFYVKVDDKSLCVPARELVVGQYIEPYELPTTQDGFQYFGSIDPSKVRITRIAKYPRKEKTYCFREPVYQKGVFEGVLTGNCAEIVEYSDNTKYAVCTLASICLPRHITNNREYTNNPNMEFFVYTKPNCIYCKLLKYYFDDIGLKNVVYDMDRDDALTCIPPMSTFPRVVLMRIQSDGCKYEFVGGFEETIKLTRPDVDYIKLRETVRQLVVNLNVIIDENFYPTVETRMSNFEARPIGIGIQGLADLFHKLWLPFTSPDAKEINKKLFEHIYYYAMEMSHELAVTRGPYDKFEGSPLSEGKFQFDLWGISRDELYLKEHWESLQDEIMTNRGVRNSLLIALMPTASTSQIMGCTESFEPMASNMYVRKTLSGEFDVLNEHLLRMLHGLGLWNATMKEQIQYGQGSVQSISELPGYIREMFKTVWELSKKDIIEMSADRGPFVDQSQSLNLFVEDCTVNKLTQILFYGYKRGLKTGSYYIRTKAAAKPQNFTIDPELEAKFKAQAQVTTTVTGDEREPCEMCSS